MCSRRCASGRTAAGSGAFIGRAAPQVAPDKAREREGQEGEAERSIELPALRLVLPGTCLEREADRERDAPQHDELEQAPADDLGRAARPDHEQALVDERQIRRDHRDQQHQPDGGRGAHQREQVWAFLGDGEMDEVESRGALQLAANDGLDNLNFVINCNLALNERLAMVSAVGLISLISLHHWSTSQNRSIVISESGMRGA